MKSLASALVAFRAECGSIKFDSTNPHFKSRYASLAAIHSTIDAILAKHQLTVMQFPIAADGRAGCRTVIVHASGEQTEPVDFMVPTAKNDPQGACSAVTYARRYSLSGALGLVTEEDDDGEAASGRLQAVERPLKQAPARAAKAPAMSKENRDKLKHAARARSLVVNGQSDDSMVMEILTTVAKSMGYASPIEFKDSDLEAAMVGVQRHGG